MKRITLLFFFIYCLISLLHIYFVFTNNTLLIHITKPALMPLLIITVYAETGLRGNLSKIFLAALAFSWLGDIVLMSDGLFIWGLVCFLIAHLFYIIYLLLIKGPPGLIQYQPLFSIPIVVYWILLAGLLNDFWEALKIPVFIYGAVICAVWAVAFNLFWKIDKKIAALFFFGSFQFVLSDSILAINRFVYPFDVLPVLVMIIYCSAQFLLTLGCIRYSNISSVRVLDHQLALK
jgi:uncharacterized membrane protein YhhN